jgi:hypothetical protein
MMIMIKSTVVVTTLFLAVTGISAEKLRGVRGLHGSHHGHKGMGSHKGKRGPKGWGDPKDEFGGPCSQFDETLLKDLSCPTDVDNEPECDVRDGGLGTWLCRTMFDRFTGESDSLSTCGNATRAQPMDDCGCCEGALPLNAPVGAPWRELPIPASLLERPGQRVKKMKGASRPKTHFQLLPNQKVASSVL